MANTDEWVPNVEQIGGDQSQVMNYVRSLMNEGRADEARAELQNVIDQDPSNTRAIMAYGMSLQRERRMEEAAEYFEQAMEVDPSNATAPLLAAMVGVQGDNPEYAEANYHKALEANPTSMQAFTGLARLHQRNKKPEAAIEVLERALEADPQSTRIRRQLATVYASMDRNEDAKKQLEMALSAQPGDQRSTLQLATLCNRMGKPEEGQKALETALSEKPDDLRLIMAVGRSKLTNKDYAGAEKHFRKAIKTPRTRQRRDGPLAQRMQQRQGGNNGRGAQLQQAMQQRGQRPNSMAQLALVQSLIPQKKLKEAREILGSARRNGRASTIIQRLYGDAYAAENKVEQAEQSYRAALKSLDDGEETLAKIDKAKSGKTDIKGKALLKLYTDEFERRMEERRARATENRDMSDIGNRIRERREQNGGGGQGQMRQRLRNRMQQNQNGGGNGGGFMQRRGQFGGGQFGGGGFGGGGGNNANQPQSQMADTAAGENQRGSFLRNMMARRQNNR